MIAYYNTLVHFKSLIIIGNIHLLQKDFKPGGFVLCQGLWVSIPFVILPVGSLSATRPNNLVWSGGECFLFFLSSSRKVKESKAFTSQLFIYYIYYYYLIYFLLFSSYYYVKKCIGPVLSLKGRYQLFLSYDLLLLLLLHTLFIMCLCRFCLFSYFRSKIYIQTIIHAIMKLACSKCPGIAKITKSST